METPQPSGRRVSQIVWVLLGVLVCLWQGPSLWRELAPPRYSLVDFFQEWASARNYWTGLPLYTNQRESLPIHLGLDPPTDAPFFIELNAHPPTSILIALPFGLLDYPAAVLAWNLMSLLALGASLLVIARGLGFRLTPSVIFSTIGLLLVCAPFHQQVSLGQLNLVLLFLFTVTWWADRSDHPYLAGIPVGLATALALFPGFLLVYFAIRRKGRALGAGVASLLSVTALTLLVFGWETFQTYIGHVMPIVAQDGRFVWRNASLASFLAKLFVASPAIAGPATCAAILVILGIYGILLWRVREGRAGDLAFGWTLITMLVLSPTTWDHRFLLLILPVAILAANLPSTARWERWLLVGMVLLMCLNPQWYYGAFLPSVRYSERVGPWQVLLVVGLPFYALLGLFLLGAQALRRAQGDGKLA